ncbi:MAG: methyltransferase domain-containing protein [Polyangiaceae bacterium]
MEDTMSPARLLLAARLFGAPTLFTGDRAKRPLRVLQIGCGRGERLLALAFHDPEAAYFGLDEDPEAVAAAIAAAQEIGLENVRFEVGGFSDPPAEIGEFDLILGGDALARRGEVGAIDVLSLGRRCLSERGALALTYPVFPGAATRAMARSLVGAAADPRAPVAKRAADVRAAAAGFKGMLGPSNHPYPQLLALELGRVEGAPDEVIAREYLDAPDTAYWHADVVRRAEAEGLRFVADAAWNQPEGHVSQEIVSEVASRGLAGAALDQALDVLRCRAERTSLFCRADAGIGDPPGGELLDELWIVSPLRSGREGESVTPDLTPGVEEPFLGLGGQRVASPDPLLKAALLELHAVFPKALRFAETVSAAVTRLHEAGADGEPSDAQVGGLARDLWELYRSGLVDLLPDPPRFPVGSKRGPVLHALARHEVASGRPPTTALYTPMELPRFEAELVRHMVPGADEDSLVGAMLLEAAKGGVAIEIGGSRLTDPTLIEPMVRGLVRRGVALLGRWGLLE